MSLEEQLALWIDGHIKHWQPRGGWPTGPEFYEWYRYEDGFRAGWKNASEGIVSSDRGTDPDPAHGRTSPNSTGTNRSEYYIARNNARAVQLVNRGHSFYMWQWDHGYTDAFRAWKRVHRS